MNSTCVFLLALAVFGAFADAYMGSVYPYGVSRGGYGVGYGVGYGSGCGCATTCSGTCATTCGPPAVCDTCQCVKTVVRPPVIERIPYSCSRRVQPSVCRSGYDVYPAASAGVYSGTAGGAGYIGGGYGGYAGGYGGGVVV